MSLFPFAMLKCRQRGLVAADAGNTATTTVGTLMNILRKGLKHLVSPKILRINSYIQ